MKQIITVLFLSLLISCGESSQEEQTIQVYDLDQEFKKVTLSLSDLMDDPELVALETTDESLISRNFQYHVGKKYIVVLDQKYILLFNREGKYLRKIATTGRGPGEFQYIYDYYINSDESRLVIVHQGNLQSLDSYDLNSNTHREIEVPGRAYSLIDYGENQLMGKGLSNDSLDYYILDTESFNVIDVQYKEAENGRGGSIPFMFKAADGALYTKGDDTLRVLKEDQFLPSSVFLLKNPLDPSRTNEGSTMSLVLISPTYMILSRGETALNFGSDGSISINSQPSIGLYINRTTGEVFKANLDFESIEGLSSIHNRINGSDEWVSIKYDASEWLDIIESRGAESLPENLITASEGLDYEDNPVLVIGNVKSIE